MSRRRRNARQGHRSNASVRLKDGTILDAKAFDKRSNDGVTAFVGMNDEIVTVVKSEITALIMVPAAAKEYFGM